LIIGINVIHTTIPQYDYFQMETCDTVWR